MVVPQDVTLLVGVIYLLRFFLIYTPKTLVFELKHGGTVLGSPSGARYSEVLHVPTLNQDC